MINDVFCVLFAGNAAQVRDKVIAMYHHTTTEDEGRWNAHEVKVP